MKLKRQEDDPVLEPKEVKAPVLPSPGQEDDQDWTPAAFGDWQQHKLLGVAVVLSVTISCAALAATGLFTGDLTSQSGGTITTPRPSTQAIKSSASAKEFLERADSPKDEDEDDEKKAKLVSLAEQGDEPEQSADKAEPDAGGPFDLDKVKPEQDGSKSSSDNTEANGQDPEPQQSGTEESSSENDEESGQEESKGGDKNDESSTGEGSGEINGKSSGESGGERRRI